VGSLGNAVFLECAVDCVAREKRLGAEWFVGLLAEFAGEAGAIEPFYANMVADFDV
jgi:hypothetical protein